MTSPRAARCSHDVAANSVQGYTSDAARAWEGRLACSFGTWHTTPSSMPIRAATNARCPTYVDDLNALTIGPGQTMAAALMVIACGFAAGLSADMHQCTTLAFPSCGKQAARILAAFPVHVMPNSTASDDAAMIAGMPAQCILGILQRAFGDSWAATATILKKECQCSVKSVVVPESGVAEWNAAMRICPFGPTTARIRHVYLGISLGGASSTLRPACGPWHDSCMERIQNDTWAAPTKRFQDRAAMITYSMSPQLHAVMLNVAYGRCLESGARPDTRKSPAEQPTSESGPEGTMPRQMDFRTRPPKTWHSVRVGST